MAMMMMMMTMMMMMMLLETFKAISVSPLHRVRLMHYTQL